jgi:CubicO group peptidase (beta-lactamase class C family)
MHLVERGKITLDEDVRPLVPELGQLPILKGFSDEGEPILVPNTKPITLRHLLTHTSGLGVDVADPDLIRWSQHVGRTANVGSCTLEGWSSPLKFAPGEGWYYGIGPEWAGQVLERATGGQRLGEYMAQHLCGPLGMEDTGFRLSQLVNSEEKEGRFVPISERSGTNGELAEGQRNMFPLEPVCESGGAGLYTSAADYAKVMQALLRALAGEEEDGGVVVGKETVRQMLAPQLNETQREWVKGIVFTFGSAAELPEGTPVDHGIGGLLTMGDVQGKRRKGSLMWSGMCNSRWVSGHSCCSDHGYSIYLHSTNVLPCAVDRPRDGHWGCAHCQRHSLWRCHRAEALRRAGEGGVWRASPEMAGIMQVVGSKRLN